MNRMNVSKRTLVANDFIPPVLQRLVERIGTRPRIHPFDCVPNNLHAKWILDVGANVGDVALAALRSYEGSAVICFEPVAETFEVLKRRLKPHEERVALFNQGLSDVNGDAEINITSFHGANSILPQSDFHKFFNPHVREMEKQTVKLVRLDEVAKKFPTKKIDIMKVDVEGYELNVLRGGLGFIRSSVDTIIVEASLMRDPSWHQQSIADILPLLKDCGFALINIYDLHKTEDSDMMLCQMDCVFRHVSRLRRPRLGECA
jgi:FkbM family methyltransferase